MEHGHWVTTDETKLVLVKFEADWADEFDVYGLAVYRKENWEKLCERFKKAEKYRSHYFGTNEGWEDDQIEDDWLDNYKATVIDVKQHQTLLTMGLGNGFGHFPCPYQLIGDWKDDEEQDEYCDLTM